MHAGKKNPEFNYKMTVEDQEIVIAKCEEEKDLRVTFDMLLKFDAHIQTCTNKANRILVFFFYKKKRFVFRLRHSC